MAKYVSKDAVLPRMEELVAAILDLLNVDSLDSDNEEVELKNTAIELWEAIPAADVRPERHGRWIPDEDCVVCSECGAVHLGHYRASYCEDCGAKMDEKDGGGNG